MKPIYWRVSREGPGEEVHEVRRLNLAEGNHKTAALQRRLWREMCFRREWNQRVMIHIMFGDELAGRYVANNDALYPREAVRMVQILRQRNTELVS